MLNTDCIKKNYTILFELLQRSKKIACPQEFRQYSKILSAACSFLNDVIPFLESLDMLNLVMSGKNKLGHFRAISRHLILYSNQLLVLVLQFSGENSMKVAHHVFTPYY